LRYAIYPTKTAVIPAELLEVIPGQPFRGKLDPNATRGVLEFTKLKPDERLKEILKGSKQLDYENSAVMKESSIRLNLDPIKIQGSLIIPPQLRLGDGMSVSHN
jgi:eukaryotic translation initiation factor 2C